jgi:hypothetical protein
MDGERALSDGSSPILSRPVPFAVAALVIYPIAGAAFLLGLGLLVGRAEDDLIFLAVPSGVVAAAFTGGDAALRGLHDGSHAWWALCSGATAIIMFAVALAILAS